MTAMLLCLEIVPSTNELVKKEIEKILGQREIFNPAPDLLLFKSDSITKDVTLLSLFSRTIVNMYLVPKVEEYKEITDLYRISKDISWPDLFDTEKSFAVISRISGIDKKIVGRLVGQGIVDRFLEDTHKRPAVNLESPDLEIAVFAAQGLLIPAIKLFKNEMNTITDIVNRLAILCCNYETRVGEIFHAGICESAFEFLNSEPCRDRILKSTFIDLLCVEHQTILDLVTRSWRACRAEVLCFVDTRESIKPNYKEIRVQPIESLPLVPIEALLCNLVLLFPRKEKQLEILNKIANLVTNSSCWNELILITRADISVDNIFNKTEKIISIALKGVPSQILYLEN